MLRESEPLLPGQRAVMGKKENELGRAIHRATEELTAQNVTYDTYISDTRSHTNRKNPEPSLFVGRVPHQVRSFAETGAYFRFDDEPRKLQIGLEDPISKPEYAIDSFLPASSHKLCLCCYDVLNYFCKYRAERAKFDASDVGKARKTPFDLSNCVVHHANLFSLFAFAEIAKCHICSILLERVDKKWDLKQSQYEDYRLEVAFSQKDPFLNTDEDKSDTLFFVMVRSDTKKEPVWNWSGLLKLYLWPVEKYLHHFEAALSMEELKSRAERSRSREGTSPYTPPAPNELAVAWLVKCMANEAGNHVPCRRQNHGYLPARLLDIRYAAETSKLRIVCPQDDPARFKKGTRYATLSHCWGAWGAAENPNLTTKNLESRKNEGIHCESLPKTFSDALDVVSWLRIPYLWIDSLCILQDSRSDWIHEASVMHLTYQFCTINISASFGIDSRFGLFANRDELSLTLQRFEAPNIPRSWYVTPDNVFDWSNTSPAFSRAWIHRERQLSPRILHFTSEGMMVWECCGINGASFASETLPGHAPFKELWRGNSKYQDSTTLRESKKGTEATYAIWDDMCERFSTKNLTVKSDMPIILSSLAEEFHKSLPDDEYLAGMWKNVLPQSLAWRTNRYWPENDTSHIAPTWSWLSAPAPTGVKFLQKARMDDMIGLAKLVEVDIVRKDGHENNKYGPVKAGTLRLDGFLRKIWFDFHKEGGYTLSVVDTLVDGDEDDNEKSNIRVVGKNWDDHEGDLCEVEFDGKIEYEEYCCWCMFTSIDEWVDSSNWDSQERSITAILLEKLGDDDNKPWSRVGMIKLNDFLAFKMRYKECYDSDTEEDENDDDGKEGTDASAIVDQTTPQNLREPIKDNEHADTMHESAIDIVELDTPAGQQPQLEQEEQRQQQQAEDQEQKTTSSAEDAQPIANSDADTNTESDSRRVTNTNDDLESRPSSPSKDDPDDKIWKSLSEIIKSTRFRVSQAERAVEEAARKAKKDQEIEANVNPETQTPSIPPSAEAVVSESKPESEIAPASASMPTSSQENEHPSDTIVEIQTQMNDTTIHESTTSNSSNITQDKTDTPTPTSPSSQPNPTSNSDQAENPNETSSTPANPDKPTNKYDIANEPPIHGRPHTDPAGALYQFDGALAHLQALGYLKWLRRLDVRRIEII